MLNRISGQIDQNMLGFFYLKQRSNFIKRIILHVGNSMNASLILAAWRHGKLFGNQCNYAAVHPHNWHKSLTIHREKLVCIYPNRHLHPHYKLLSSFQRTFVSTWWHVFSLTTFLVIVFIIFINHVNPISPVLSLMVFWNRFNRSEYLSTCMRKFFLKRKIFFTTPPPLHHPQKFQECLIGWMR